MEELKDKIRSCWAFAENPNEIYKKNREIYEQIKDKAEVRLISTGYAKKVYEVISNPESLSMKELALIADKGNLCFGYRTRGNYEIIIHTD